MSKSIQRSRKSNKTNERPDRLGTNIYSAKDQQSMHKSLNGHFVLYQLLLEQIFDEKQPLVKEKVSLVEYFQPKDEKDTEAMTEFDTEYKVEKAINWYTRETCIYKILNKSLRTQNFYDIFPFGPYIKDLSNQLSDEHKLFIAQQKTSHMTFYRGQFISKDELNRLKTSLGELLSVNSFLSTSTGREKALEFAISRPPPNDQLISVLLEISADLNSTTKPFAGIKQFSAFAEEEEVLFMFATIFRIEDVSQDEKKKIWIIKLKACEEDDKGVKTFLSSIDEDIDGQSRFISLGHYFTQVYEYDHAEEHFLNVIEGHLVMDDLELAYTYYGLAQVNNKKGDYDLALKNIKKALEYALDNPSLATPSSNNPALLSLCYNELGSIYVNRKDYNPALQAFSKALSTNYNKWKTYAALSDAHYKMNNLHLALEHLTKCVEHQSKTAYALMGNSYIDMAKIYAKLNQRDKVTEYSEKALEYQLKELDPTHPDLSTTYNILGSIFLDLNEERKAFDYFAKAYNIQMESLPSYHPEYAESYRNFANLYLKQDNLEKGLLYYEKVLENQLKTLASNHPSVMESYRAIEDIHMKNKTYAKASMYTLKLLNAQLERKQLGHTSLTISYQKLDDVTLDDSILEEALELCFKLLNDALETKLRQDILLAPIYKTIGKCFYKQRCLNRSLVYFYRYLDCCLEKKPFEQSVIDEIYHLIGKVYLKKHHFDQTLLHYEKPNNEKLLNEDTSVDMHKLIAEIYFERCHLEQSCHYFKRLIHKKLKKHSGNCLSLIERYHIVANICLDQKDFDEALKYFLLLLDSSLARKTTDDRSLKNIHKAIATLYFEKANYSQSLIYFNRLLDYQLKTEKIEHPSIYDTYTMIGKIYLKKNHFHSSPDYLNKFMGSRYKPNLQYETLQMSIQSFVYNREFEKRHLNQAFAYFQKLIHGKAENQSFEDICVILGNITLEQNNFDRALTCFQTLLNIQLKRNLSQDAPLANTFVIFGNIYAQTRRVYEASQNYRHAVSIYQAMHPVDQSLVSAIQCKINHLNFPSF